PNPTIEDEAFIDPGSGGVRSVEVLDAVGRIVARYGTVRTIPAPRLPGSYLVRVTGADGRTTVLRWIRQ
ncbi:MAG: T9SS type A sorting domain-containing protein, partial [Flavobacteriales bacterium]|nr:T9SS type A sorting domain-containing protein [Flavobacteriales bacterium]